MNLLSLISLYLNINCQITTKYATIPKFKLFRKPFFNKGQERCQIMLKGVECQVRIYTIKVKIIENNSHSKWTTLYPSQMAPHRKS